MRKKRKIVWQIYLSYLVIILVVLMAVAWYASHSVKQFYLQKTREYLEAHAKHFRIFIEKDMFPDEDQDKDGLCKTVGQELSTRMTIILPSGQVICDSFEDPSRMDNHADRPEIQQAFLGHNGTAIRYSYTLEQEMMYV